MTQELRDLVQGLRSTSQRLNNQTEAIANAIARLGGNPSSGSGTASTPYGSGSTQYYSGLTPPSSRYPPDIRQQRTPRYESSRVPGFPRPNPNPNNRDTLSPIVGPHNPSQSSGSNQPYISSRPNTSSTSPSYGSGSSRSYPDSGSTLANIRFNIDPNSTDDDTRCTCNDPSTIAEGRIRLNLDSINTSDNSPYNNSSRQEYPSILRNLIDWWSAFILENVNSDGTTISSEREYIESLSSIVQHWEDISRRSH